VAVQFKICGLTRPEDARSAELAGARYGGVILAPGGPRTVDAAQAAAVFADRGLCRCGVFVNESPDRLHALAAYLRLDVVQLHGDEPPEVARSLREGGRVEVWKAVRPRSGDEFLEAVRSYGGVVDALLLDGWSAAARGGTGARFPWHEVARHRSAMPAGSRLVVAGGLNPGNVSEIIRILAPDVVDVSSGVEHAPGVKDPDAIRSFAAVVAAASKEEG
jgi:phosphoribosylanthranilate isomerase